MALKKLESKGIEKLELKRQFFHIGYGIILVLLVYYNIIYKTGLLIILLAAFGLSLLCRKYELPVFEWFLKKFERPPLLTKFPGKGPIYFTLGSLLSLALFDKNVALAGIIILTLGDSLAHIFGKSIGKYHLYNLKAIEGMGIGILAAFCGAILFVPPLAAFLGSLAAMTVETFELKIGQANIDDNLFIPLIAAGTIHLVLLL